MAINSPSPTIRRTPFSESKILRISSLPIKGGRCMIVIWVGVMNHFDYDTNKLILEVFQPLTFWHLLFSSPWLKNRGSRNSEMTGNSAFLQHSKNAADISYSCFSFSKTRKLFETEADMFPGFVICQINWNRYLEQNKTISLQKLFGVAARKFTQWLFCAHTYFPTFWH